MATNTKRVFYVNTLSAPVYLEILAKRADIQIDKLVNDSPEAEAERILPLAHAYQIGSSRQELAMKYQGYTPLLDRCPNLVVLSTNGAGFDTVNLDDATAAGIAVVNQAGGNKEGVAEQMLDILDGKRPPRLLNPEVWPAYQDRFQRILGLRPEN